VITEAFVNKHLSLTVTVKRICDRHIVLVDRLCNTSDKDLYVIIRSMRYHLDPDISDYYDNIESVPLPIGAGLGTSPGRGEFLAANQCVQARHSVLVLPEKYTVTSKWSVRVVDSRGKTYDYNEPSYEISSEEIYIDIATIKISHGICAECAKTEEETN